MDNNTSARVHCMECQAGYLRRKYVTYFTWIGEVLITVQNFPAWVCDVCGRREYDHQALNQLNLILSPNAGKSAGKRGRRSGLVDGSGGEVRPGRVK